MATQVQNASAILDALADSMGKTLTNQQKIDWVERFIDDIGGADDNETKATKFNETLANIIRSAGKSHVENAQRQANEAAVAAAGDAVAVELEP